MRKDLFIFGSMLIMIILISFGLGAYVVHSDKEDRLEDLLEILHEFADSHEYDREHYNCVNHSVDLQQVLRENGYRSKMITGCTYNMTAPCHRWLRLELDIDSVSGTIKDYRDKYPVQSETNGQH